jgi:hypothetical protein
MHHTYRPLTNLQVLVLLIFQDPSLVLVAGENPAVREKGVPKTLFHFLFL